MYNYEPWSCKCRVGENCTNPPGSPKCETCKRYLSEQTITGERLEQKTAVKHDQGKPDLSHISYELVEAVALVRDFGAKKYSRNNWKKGFKVTRSCAAALRHIFLFLSGETNDSESGLSHLGHAVCCLEHAIYDMKHHPENDDRKGE